MCLQEVYLGVGESIPVLIQFDPSYKDDFVTRTAESQLEVLFKEHPQTVNNILPLCLLKKIWNLNESWKNRVKRNFVANVGMQD